ncbi:MAG: CPBP family intramembrane metalloprotease [Treponema sp.]|nr:CPBP family intramembrane metalloprotease [Treponema sp.]
MKNKNILSSVLLIYIICFVLRLIEYFILRTDSTVIGEALFHKLAGIAILIIFARIYKYKADEVGFSLDKFGLKLASGLLFGIFCFAIAYFVEVLITKSSGSYTGLQFYVTSYSVNGNLGNQTGLFFFALCIFGNIVNVVMEEGVFRGLFIRRLQEKFSYSSTAIISAVLFGFWHGVAPVRSFIDGELSTFGLFMNCLILILSSAVVGYKYGLITKITGSGFMAMGDHFVNNTLVNILHVVSANGTDQFQMVRISIAQTLSFILVLAFYFYSKNHKKAVQLSESIE